MFLGHIIYQCVYHCMYMVVCVIDIIIYGCSVYCRRPKAMHVSCKLHVGFRGNTYVEHVAV